MRQALHIFRKDTRYLWREICLVLALAAIFAWINPMWMDMLLLAASSYLIARLVHAEAIPGDRQFWITRPYRCQSLLAAKLLFMLAFVNLPILLAQWRIVAAGGFPFSSYVGGLLWSQVLLVLVVTLPVVGLAAITRSIVPFTFVMLILTTLWFVMDTTLISRADKGLVSWPGAFEWIRNSATVLILATVVVLILYMQYRRRRTIVSRAIAAAGLAVIAALWFYLPWQKAWALQARLSKQPVANSLWQISPDSKGVRFQIWRARTWDVVYLHVPIAVAEPGNGLEFRVDTLDLTLEGADGSSALSDVGSVKRGARKSGRTMLEADANVSSGFMKRQQGKPVTIRGSLYLTLFGNPREKTIPLRGEPVNALDGLQCNLDLFDQFICRSAFRWPAGMVYGKSGEMLSPLTGLISYSPFPAVLRLNPLEAHWAASVPRSKDEVTVAVIEPLAHVRRDFEIRDVRVVTVR